jgi:HK97 family phage portal protein
MFWDYFSKKKPTIAIQSIPKATFTPRRYDTLCKEGYHHNVIVYRCVKLISQGIAAVPFLLYEKKNGIQHEITHHPILDLLAQPSPYQARCAFMEQIVSSLLLAGNAYIESVCNYDSLPIELYHLRPDRMTIIPHESGRPWAFEYTVDQRKRIIHHHHQPYPKVLHLKFFHPLDDWYGMSPLEAAATAIDQHNTVSAHNLALLQNGGRPSGAFIIKSSYLSDEQRSSLRNDLKNIYEGHNNAGKILMLEGDFSWQEMGLSPKDLDFIEGKNVSAREIAQAFGVPPMLVGVKGDATFSNYKEARFHLWEDTILPLLEFIIAELNLWLVPYFCQNQRLSIGYDVDHIPALAPKREAHWAKIQDASFLSDNEKREAVGYTPL